jgi:hypothetical protein
MFFGRLLVSVLGLSIRTFSLATALVATGAPHSSDCLSACALHVAAPVATGAPMADAAPVFVF